MILRSEKKMKKELQGKWQRSFLGISPVKKCSGDSTLYKEFWSFNGDYLYVTNEYEDMLGCESGVPDVNYADLQDTLVITKFEIDARTLKAYLKLQLIDRGNDSTAFVDKWEFITLDDDVLYIATDDPKGNSVLQREFFKVK
jgi:hypothetical protein